MGDQNDPYDSLERVEPASLTARVPEAVAAGVFATGAIVLHSPTEVIIDFAQGIAKPQRIGVRVVMTYQVAVQFSEALALDILVYESAFGLRPREPEQVSGKSQNDADVIERSPDPSDPASHESDTGSPIADSYDQLKATDEVLGGVYANTVTISHTGSEFHFDFIMRCFPRSIVTARVYMAAPRVVTLLDSLKKSLRMT